MKKSWLFILIFSISFSLLSQTEKPPPIEAVNKKITIKAVNKSKHKDILIIINHGAPQVKNTYITETMRAQFVKKEAAKDPAEKPAEDAAKEPAKEPEQEPIIMRNFVKKEKTMPDDVYEIKSTQIKPSSLWNATVFQGKQIFVANLQEHPALKALENKVEITIEISDDGQLKFIPSCPCPPAVDVVAKEGPKK